MSSDFDPDRADRVHIQDQAYLSSLRPQRKLRRRGGSGHRLGEDREQRLSRQPHGG